MNKIPTVCLMILAMIFGSMALEAAGTAEQPAPASEAPGRIVEDSLGRQVALPARVDKVACLYAFTGHVTAMLGRGSDIVAVVPGLKRDKILNRMVSSLENAVTTSLDGVVNIEELLNTKPDLIFVKGESYRMEAEREKLERFNLPYLVIEFNTMEEQMGAIEIIAAALDREEEGRAYTDYYRGTVEKTRRALADLPENEKIRAYHSVNEAVRTDAPGTLPAQWLEVAGVENVSLDASLTFRDNKYFASLEQIYLWDPDVILANEGGVPRYLMTNEKWAGLRAIKEGRVYQIPIGLSRWGHPGGMETPLAILWTAKTLYPEYTREWDLDGEIKDFYLRFFDLSLDDEMLSAIYRGEEMRMAKGTKE